MGDSALVALMLGSQLASWIGFQQLGLAAVGPIAALYWLWAARDRAAGPHWKTSHLLPSTRNDLGVVTFAIVFGSEYYFGDGGGSSAWRCAAPALMTLHFGLSAINKCLLPSADMSDKLGKSVQWAQAFQLYCASSAVFWGAVTYSAYLY